MLKKILYGIIVSCLLVLPGRAELKVDIVAGNVSPVSIAIQKVETETGVSKSDAEMVRNVVENDLKSTTI